MENKTKNEMRKMDREIAKRFMYRCGSSLHELEKAVARMAIDMTPTGVMEQEYVVLVKCIDGRKPVLSYYPRDGDDVLLNHYKCWFKFPMFYYKDMVEEEEEGFFVPRRDGTTKRIMYGLAKRFDMYGLVDWLVYDLTVNNYGDFFTYWEEFLAKFLKWIMEVE